MIPRALVLSVIACICFGSVSSRALAQGDTQPVPDALAPPTASEFDSVKEKELPWPSEFFKSLQFKGFLDTSYTFNLANAHPGEGPDNRGRIFDIYSNQFMLNSFLLQVEREVNPDQILGFKVTPMIGQDTAVTQAVGLFKDDTGTSQGSLDLLNAYLQGYVPWTGTKVKVGKFETTAGAEIIEAPWNDNFSRSFLFGYAIPFTHLGIMLDQPLVQHEDQSNLLAVSVGVSNGWDNVHDLNQAKMIHTNATFSPCDEFSLAGNFFFSFSEQPSVIVEDAATTGGDGYARRLFDLVATIKPLDGFKEDLGALGSLKFLLNLDVADEEHAIIDAGSVDPLDPLPAVERYAQWWGFSGIARMDFALFNEKHEDWFVAVRGEYFDDVDGARTQGLLGGNTGMDLWEMTFTLGYQPMPSLLLRTEFRYDKASENVFYRRSGDAAGDPDRSYQATIAFEAAFLF